jgi:hypothetical protein
MAEGGFETRPYTVDGERSVSSGRVTNVTKGLPSPALTRHDTLLGAPLESSHDFQPLGARTTLNRVLVCTAMAVAWLLVATCACQRSRGRETVAALASRFTLGEERQPGRSEFDRSSGPDVYFRVVLSPAPLGRVLSLDCDWTDPSGAIARQNHYQTKEITTPQWETHCHQRFQADALPGVWRVELKQAGRVIRQDSFALR